MIQGALVIIVRRCVVLITTLAVVGWAAAGVAHAAPSDSPAAAQAAPSKPPAIAAVSAANPPDTEADEVQDADDETPTITWDPYGYIKLDAAVDGAAIEPGNFARWVANPGLDHQHTHFNMTARQTRLGLWVVGPEEASFQVRGRVEIDFYGGGGENKNGVMLRHAYLQIDWPGRDLRLIAGQTFDIISPLVPRTVNYTVAWWSGNIGYRRPLASLTKNLRFGDGASRLILTGGVSRTIGDDFKPTEPGDAGADSGLPTVQGRVAYSWTAAGRLGALGFSGHWGQEDVGTGLGLEDHEFDSWSANLDLQIPLGGKVTLKAEVFTGENLDDYFGGIGQGINVDLGCDVAATGGWASLELDATDKARFAVGFGVDDPVDEDLASGARSLNRSVWGNWFYDFTDYLSTAAEVSWWATDYKDEEDGTAFRVQGAMIFSF